MQTPSWVVTSLLAGAMILGAHGCAANGSNSSSTLGTGGAGVGGGREITGAGGAGEGAKASSSGDTSPTSTPAATTDAATTTDAAATTDVASTGQGGFGVGGGSGEGGFGTTAASTSRSSASATASTGSGQSCSQFGESNDTQTDAYDVGGGMEMDCDDSSMKTLHAAISDANDVDWYKYEGDDGDFCSPDAYGLVTSNGGVQLTLCIFLQCVNGDPENVSCPGGSFPETSDLGDLGCCSTGEMDIDVDCSGSIDDSSYVYMSVEDRTHSQTCTAYDLTWHF